MFLFLALYHTKWSIEKEMMISCNISLNNNNNSPISMRLLTKSLSFYTLVKLHPYVIFNSQYVFSLAFSSCHKKICPLKRKNGFLLLKRKSWPFNLSSPFNLKIKWQVSILPLIMAKFFLAPLVLLTLFLNSFYTLLPFSFGFG